MAQLIDTAQMKGEVRTFLVEGDVTDDEARRIIDGDTLGGRAYLAWEDHNLITNIARQRVAALAVAESTSSFVVPGWIGVGTTAIVPTATTTSLTGETFRKAVATVATLATYYSRYQVNYTTSDTNGTYLGMGLFASSSGGDMWALVSTSIVKSTAQALIGEWRVNIVSA